MDTPTFPPLSQNFQTDRRTDGKMDGKQGQIYLRSPCFSSVFCTLLSYWAQCSSIK